MQCTDECVCWLARHNGSYMHTHTFQCLLVMGIVSLSKDTPNVYHRPVCVLFVVHAHFAVQFMGDNIYYAY